MFSRLTAMSAIFLVIVSACAVDPRRAFVTALHAPSAADADETSLLLFEREGALEACLANDPDICLPLDGADSALDDATIEMFLAQAIEIMNAGSFGVADSERADELGVSSGTWGAIGVASIVIAIAAVRFKMRRKTDIEALRGAARTIGEAIVRDADRGAEAGRALIATNYVTRNGLIELTQREWRTHGFADEAFREAWSTVVRAARATNGEAGGVLRALGERPLPGGGFRHMVSADGTLRVPTIVDDLYYEIRVPPGSIEAAERFVRLESVGLHVRAAAAVVRDDPTVLLASLSRAQVVVSVHIDSLIRAARGR